MPKEHHHRGEVASRVPFKSQEIGDRGGGELPCAFFLNPGDPRQADARCMSKLGCRKGFGVWGKRGQCGAYTWILFPGNLQVFVQCIRPHIRHTYALGALIKIRLPCG